MSKSLLSRWSLALSMVGGLLVPLSCGSDIDEDGGKAAAGSTSGGDGPGGQGNGGEPLNLGGSLATGDAGGGGAGPVCPPYQALCAGRCIPTSVDPLNCGDCGHECAAEQVCSSGVCSDDCPSGFATCAGSCVDLDNDSAHCGDCDSACDAGQGCANGLCTDAVPLGPTPARCKNGGPPISVGEGDEQKCLGTLAQTTFRWSLCSCTDLNVSAALTTDAYDSTVGPYAPGQTGGGVGVDRDVTNWSEAVKVGGTLWVAGSDEYSSSGPPSEVKGDMHLGGSWTASTEFAVEGDASYVGSLSGVSVAGKSEKVASVPPACDCSPTQLVPIAAIVDAHRTDNDNAAIGLDPAVLESPTTALRLDLPCGNYYFTQIDTSLALTVHVHGHTALYVAGDVRASSALAFVLDPDASLDLFVTGTLKASDTFVFGSPLYPALSRAYVGGAAKLALSDDVRLAGQLYAANSEQVVWSASNDIYGSVFAGSFRSSDVTNIHYDRGVLRAGDECPPGGGECGSCEDCHNQACKDGVCGDCETNSDCCSPLVCRSGTCVAMILK